MWRKIETFPFYRVFHADSSAFLIVILKLDFFNDEKLCLKYNYRVVTRYVGSEKKRGGIWDQKPGIWDQKPGIGHQRHRIRGKIRDQYHNEHFERGPQISRSRKRYRLISGVAVQHNVAPKNWEDRKLTVMLNIEYLSDAAFLPILRLCITHIWGFLGVIASLMSWNR